MSLRSAYCKIRKYATSIAEIKLQRLRCPQSDWSGQKAVAGLSSHQHSVIWFWAQYRSAVKPCFCDFFALGNPAHRASRPTRPRECQRVGGAGDLIPSPSPLTARLARHREMIIDKIYLMQQSLHSVR